MPENLNELIEWARALGPMTPEQLRQQSLSIARAEQVIGSDRDEVEFARAARDGDIETMEILRAEGELRLRTFNKYINKYMKDEGV